MYKKLVLIAAIAVMSWGAQAADVVTFEGVISAKADDNNSGKILSSGLGAFTWASLAWSTPSSNNLQLIDETRATGNKALANIASLMGSAGEPLGQWVGYLNSNNSVSFASLSVFNFDSIFLYSKASSDVSITSFDSNGQRLASTTLSLGAQSGSSYSFSEFSGVNKITISGSNLAFDNITLSAVSPVPEPATYAMLLAGLGLVGLMVRRRQA